MSVLHLENPVFPYLWECSFFHTLGSPTSLPPHKPQGKKKALQDLDGKGQTSSHSGSIHLPVLPPALSVSPTQMAERGLSN